ncbi:MAG: hypothetical protein ABEL51_07865 [Salinibacter sp.]
MPHFTSSALDSETGDRASFPQHLCFLKAEQASGGPQDQASSADWWAHHTGGVPATSDEASSLDIAEDEDRVGNVVAAFRTALRQAEHVDSAAELQNNESMKDGPGATDSLNYFAPAFRRVLGGDEEEKKAEALASVENAGAEGADATDSLDYFAPAFHRALGAGDGAVSAPDARNVAEASEDGIGNRGDAEDASLEYFAPAFRKALGDCGQAAPEAGEANADEEAQGAVQRFEETVEAMSPLPRLELPEVVHAGSKLDRIAEGFFGRQPQDLVVNGH